MKKILVAAILMYTILMLSGCGGGGDSPPPVVVVPQVVTRILSTQAFDGDILNGSTVSPLNAASVYAGIDPFSLSEYRAFLVFPLTGLGGVPGSAYIDAATLDLFINSITLHPSASSIPIRIELVSYPPQTLQASDYYRTSLPPLYFTTIIPPISGADVLRHVSIDVTSLMVEAQRRGLSDFQIRILEDDGFVFPGLIETNDATINRAPLLTVTYH